MEQTENMKELLQKEFQDDPIYRLALLNNLEEFIFTDKICSMHKDPTYSTVDAGKIIERSDSTIRNHFRSELLGYINPEKLGKFYRLRYNSIFRLHLIFLLMDKSGKTTIDILAELGEFAGEISGSESKLSQKLYGTGNRGKRTGLQRLDTKDNNYELEFKLDLQEMQINILSHQWEVSVYEKDITRNQSKIKDILLQSKTVLKKEITNNQATIKTILLHSKSNLESELSEVERQIVKKTADIREAKEQIRVKYLEERQAMLLANSLKSSMKKTTFFGLIKKGDDINIHQLANEIDANLKEKYNKELQENLDKYSSELKTLKSNKEEVKGKLDKLNKGLVLSLEINEMINLLDNDSKEKVNVLESAKNDLEKKKENIERCLVKLNDDIETIPQFYSAISTLDTELETKINVYVSVITELLEQKNGQIKLLEDSKYQYENTINGTKDFFRSIKDPVLVINNPINEEE